MNVSDRPEMLLLGAGGHARACIDVIEQDGRFAIGGLIGVSEEVGVSVLDYPVLGTDADLPELLSQYPLALVTIGQIKTPEPRVCLFRVVRQGLSIGRNSVIGMGQLVLPTLAMGHVCRK